jgi:hypothetical protein
LVVGSYGNDLALVVLLLMFLEEWVIHEFLDGGALIGVLLQALIQKVPHLCGYAEVGRDLYLVLHYLDQLFLASYLEGVLPHHHLVHHYADRPNIDLLVIFTSF